MITTAWNEVEIALLEHFHQPDLEAARCFYAAMAAHDLHGQPVWPMVVAPPSCGKTELLSPMEGVPNVHRIDSITPNTFISGRAPEPGKPKGKDGLLERIGNNAILLFSDFSTVLSKHRDHRAEIFAQLRVLYDGKYRKEVGIAGLTNEWRGRLTLGAACTSAIDRYTAMFGALGDRFVFIRWRRVGGIDAAIAAMDQNIDAKNAAMQTAVHGLFAAWPTAPDPQLPPAMKPAIAACAEFVALARTPIIREQNDNVVHESDPEGTARLAQQFCQLAKGSARLDGRTEVNADDLRIVHRVAFDTLAPDRAAVLRELMTGQKVASGAPSRTSRWRAFDDLGRIGLITTRGEGGRSLTAQCHELVAAARLAA